MAICANPNCRRQLTDYQWGEGYCSYQCMASHSDMGLPTSETLHDPTGKIVVARNSCEVSAMLEAASIDARLPSIIYLRRLGSTLPRIAEKHRISRQMVAKILARLPLNLMRECGLR